MVARADTAVFAVDSAVSSCRAVLLVIGAATVLRIALASVGGLGFDESYMAANARIFALSYVDAPPLHVWLVGLVSRLFDSDNPLLLRLPFIALFAASSWLMYRLTTKLFGSRAGLWAVISFNLAPVFTLAHASWILPDGPLIFFSLATANIVTGIVLTDLPPRRATLLWIAAGICAGLAMISKYHGAFLFLAILTFLITVPEQRRWLAMPGPWLGAFAAFIIFLPVLVWNLQHGLVGATFQADRLSGSSGLTLRFLPQSLGGQIAYLTPWAFVILVYGLGRAFWRGPSSPREWLLALLAIGPIAVFTGAALFAPGLPHWEMPGWLFAFPLLGAVCVELTDRWSRFMRGGTTLWAGVLVSMLVILTIQLGTGAIGRAAPGLFSPRDPTLDLIDWTELGPAMRDRALIDDKTPAVAALYWMEAGKANFAIGRDVPVLCLCADPQQFKYLTPIAQFIGKDLILVGTRDILNNNNRMPNTAARFQRIEPLPAVVLHRGSGQPAFEVWMFRGVGFRG